MASETVKNIKVEFKVDLSEFNKQMQSVSTKIDEVSSTFKSTASDIQKSGKKMTQNSGLEDLADQAEETSEAIEDTAEAFEDATDSFEELADVVDETTDALAEAGDEAETTSTNAAEVGSNTHLDTFNSKLTLATSKLSAVGKAMQSVGKKMTSIGKSMTKCITTPILAAGGALAVLDQKFDEATATIRAGTGATGEALEELNDSFKEVYSKVPQGMDEVSSALADLNTRTGLTGKELEGLTQTMLTLSRICGDDVNSLIASSTRLFGDWGIEIKDATDTMDYLWNVSQTTGIGVDTLAQKMVQFGAPLRQMGFDFETSAALMGKWEKEGVNAELVLSSMRIALGKFANEGIADTNEALMELIDRIQLAGSTGEANAIAMDWFGAKAGPDMAAAIREGRFELDDLLTTLNASGETIEAAGKETMTFKDNMALLKNELAVALEPLADMVGVLLVDLIPIFKEFIGHITNAIKWFASLDEGTQKMIFTFVGLAAALGPVLSVVGTVVSAIGGIMTAVSAAMPVITGIGTAISGAIGAISWPMVAIVAAIAAVVAGIWWLFNNWDTACQAMSAVWDWLCEKWSAVVNWVVKYLQFCAQKWSEIFTNIKNFFVNIWNNITSFFQTTLNNIKTFLINALNFYINKWKEIFTAIGNFFMNTWNNIKSFFQNIMNSITSFASNAWSGLKNMICNFASGIKNGVVSAFQGLKNGVMGVWNGIVSGIKGCVNGIIKLVNSMIRGLNKFNVTMPDWIPGVGGKSIGFNIPEIPLLATGGLLQGTAIVGEAGPELLQQTAHGTKVTPLSTHEKASGISGALGGGFTVHIEKFVNNTDKDIEELSYKLVSHFNKNMKGRGLSYE